MKIAPGLTLNLSKSGGSLSFGPRGAKYTIGSRGRRTTVGIPGTGLFYTSSSSGSAKRTGLSRGTRRQAAPPVPTVPAKDHLTIGFFKRLVTPAGEEAFVDGCCQLAHGNEAAAIRFLKQATHLADGAFLAGFLALKAGRAKESIPLLRQAEQKSLELGQYFNKYGILPTLGLPIANELTAYVGPSIRGVMLSLVEAYQRAAEWTKAHDCLKRLRKLEPNDVIILLSLVELLWEANHGNEETCRYIVRLTKDIKNETPIHTVLLLYKARALRGMNMNDAAKDILTAALRRKKDRSQDLMLTLRYERALTYEAMAAEADSQKRASVRHRASGLWRRARTDFDRIYAEEPDFEDVAGRLADTSGSVGEEA